MSHVEYFNPAVGHIRVYANGLNISSRPPRVTCHWLWDFNQEKIIITNVRMCHRWFSVLTKDYSKILLNEMEKYNANLKWFSGLEVQTHF